MAENGRSEGAAINMITKSGTNNYHGSIFGYFRDTALNTDEKVPDGLGGQFSAHPDYTRHQFGGSIGGPIKKDKLFGFFAIERSANTRGWRKRERRLTNLPLPRTTGWLLSRPR